MHEAEASICVLYLSFAYRCSSGFMILYTHNIATTTELNWSNKILEFSICSAETTHCHKFYRKYIELIKHENGTKWVVLANQQEK